MTPEKIVEQHVFANVNPFVYPMIKAGAETACYMFDLDEDEYFSLFESQDYEQAVRDWIDNLYIKNIKNIPEICGERDIESASVLDLRASLESEGDWEDFANEYNIEPYTREVYEHWIVSDWLARQLESQGETVVDFGAGCRVWCRTTTGQAISMDYVIQKIAEEDC